MSESARELLVRGIAAAQAKDNDEARFFLERVTRTDADRGQKAQAWLWLSQISDDPAEKRDCLEEALANDPSNALARRGLAILDGRLNPAEIINPDRQPAPPQEKPPQSVQTQRFVCQKCGGKMAFMPGGKSLQCQYCGDQRTLFAALNDGSMLQEQDFTVAMATARGHARPVDTRSFACQGCGASFVLAPDVLSTTCAFCGSAHVAELPETRQLVPPEGVIPFSLTEQDARQMLLGWLKKKKLHKKAQVSKLRGLYMPAWTFDLVGEIRWQCYIYKEEGGDPFTGGGKTRKQVLEKGNYPVYEDDTLVPASHKLPSDLVMKEVDRYLLGEMAPYDSAYLADWPAEVYEIAVSDASLVARRKTLEKARKFVRTRLNATAGSYQDLTFSTAGLVVESFKLVLLPVWIARYRHQETVYHIIVNGQTGKVRAQMPQNLLQKFFRKIFE